MFINKKPAPSLASTLSAASADRHATAESEAAAADSFARLAKESASKAQTARDHAAALERAYGVLQDAGVVE